MKAIDTNSLNKVIRDSVFAFEREHGIEITAVKVYFKRDGETRKVYFNLDYNE